MTPKTMHNLPSGRRYLLLLLAVLLAVPVLFSGKVILHLSGTLPEMHELRQIRHHQSSRVLSRDGRLLGSYFFQNRTEIELQEVSPLMIDALLAVEDIRFHEHRGVDRRAMARVLVRSILLGQDAGGGSTITQQLAKNLYPRQTGGWASLTADKLREIITARRLEKLYSKDEILELYLNTVSFGEETFGIETASRRFFSKPTGDLELHEAAMLAGMLRAPGLYHPQRYPERAFARRNVVIGQMEKYGMISPEKAEESADLPLSLRYSRTTVSEGPATHFRERLRSELQTLLRTRPAADGRHYNLYTDGLVIRTTIDSRLQAAAEEAVNERMRLLQEAFDNRRGEALLLPDNDPVIRRAWQLSPHYRKLADAGTSPEKMEEIFHTPKPMKLFTWDGEIEKEFSPHDSLRHYLSFLNAGFLALAPGSGEVRAWVGGIHHKYFQYDHVSARRQPGSAFKPVVYAAALESGLRPCDYHRNQLSSYAVWDDWTPRNIGDEYGGYYSAQAALANSINTIAVDILMETGIDRVRENAVKLGITSPVPAEPSIALGTAEVSLFELTQAYAVFASGGQRVEPYYIEAIYDSRGRILYSFENPNSGIREEVISPDHAAAMVNMLRKAVDEGTGSALRSRFGIAHAVAGKTGTSQRNADGWFVGMTPDLVFGAWVGGWSPGIRSGDPSGTASQTALPIAGRFLQIAAGDPELAPPAEFYPHQVTTTYRTSCADYRDESTLDRFRNFLTGRSSEQPRQVEAERERTNLIDRVRNIFRRR